MTSAARFPVYRLVGPSVCRQDIPGGDWTSLSKDEANDLLSAFDGNVFCKTTIVEPPDENALGPSSLYVPAGHSNGQFCSTSVMKSTTLGGVLVPALTAASCV